MLVDFDGNVLSVAGTVGPGHGHLVRCRLLRSIEEAAFVRRVRADILSWPAFTEVALRAV